MKDLTQYIESGILELYVLGQTTPEETAEVEQLAQIHPEIRSEIDEISETIENFALSNAVVPPPTAKPFLLATLDYMSRLQNGEKPSVPPMLHENSRIADYSEWLNRSDMTLPEDFKDIHAKIIGAVPGATTAIVWISRMAPQEVHDDEYEKFLIVEGTCDIVIGSTTHKLVPGDCLSIPLHTTHHVKVTSSVPCKVILQRIAA